MPLRGRKLILAGGAAALAVASPLAYTLGSTDLGNTVSASIIAATAVAALTIPLWPGRTDNTKPATETSKDTLPSETGTAPADQSPNPQVRVHAGRGGIAAGGNITDNAIGNNAKVTRPPAPDHDTTKPDHRTRDVTAGPDGIAAGGDITGNAIGDDGTVE